MAIIVVIFFKMVDINIIKINHLLISGAALYFVIDNVGIMSTVIQVGQRVFDAGFLYPRYILLGIDEEVVESVWEHAFHVYDQDCKQAEPQSTTTDNRRLMQSYLLGKRRKNRKR